MHRRPRHWAGTLLAIATVVGAAASCVPQDQAGQAGPAVAVATPRVGGRVVVGINGEPDGFLPTINRWTPSSLVIARAIFEPLTAVDSSGITRPYLAEALTPDASYRRWTVQLRAGIRFHDDTPLTSAALQTHLEAVMASPITAPGLSYISRMSRADDLTLVIDMREPWTEFPTLLASQIGYVAAPSMYRDQNAGAPSHPIGTGPFRFAEWQPGRDVRIVRNPSYWRRDQSGGALPYLSEVEFRPISDEDARLQELEAGSVDLIQAESYAVVSDLQRRLRDDVNGPIRSVLDDTESTESSVVFNAQTGPFADRDLRLAAAHAVDRQGLIADLYGGFYALADGPYSAQSYWGEPDRYPEYSPALARRLVSDWTVRNGKAPHVRITNIVGADSVALSMRLARAWSDAGFDVELLQEEEKAGTVQLVTGNSDAVILRYWDRPDPDSLYQFLISDTIAPPGAISINFARYRSAVVDDALKAARRSSDREERRRQYQRIWNDFADNVPILFLFHVRWAAGFRSQVHGLGESRLPDGAPAETLNWGTFDLSAVWVQ